MLNLESPQWAELEHAYGSASDIPILLKQLVGFPTSKGTSEPWHSLWSSLAHQGDVYSASFAAVPHVVEILASNPSDAPADFLLFPVWVEICRSKKAITVLEEFLPSYADALKRLSALACHALQRQCSEDLLLSGMAAIAVAKGFAEKAEVILELTQETAPDILQWLESR